jgi:redox-sensitive bicupin YhaK (pirin superfamily)
MIDAMKTLRKSESRGGADHGWLKARHSFSFAGYFDPRHMGFRSLRVINEDRVAPGAGFPMHAHRDMEILTWMLAGELEHRDSLGNGSVIRVGELQYMCAGTGVRHSEFNHSNTAGVHLLQIWILPDGPARAPRHEQRDFRLALARNDWILLASGTGSEGSITIHQDACVWALKADDDLLRTRELGSRRGAWIQCARGSIEVQGTILSAGDALCIEGEREIQFRGARESEILYFDLA